MHQLVIGGAQDRIAGIRPEAGSVDQRLRMLDPKAQRKRLGFQVHPTRIQHLESITRAVADCQHHMVAGDILASLQRHAANPSVGDVEILDLALEAKFTTQFLDRGAHLFYHLHQAECADVRLADVQDFRRRVGLDEFHQDLAAVMLGILDLAPEFAIRKSTGTALTILHVRFGMQLALAPQAKGVLGALAHCLATLQDDRPKAHLRQDQSGEQAARTGADDHRAILQPGGSLRHEMVTGVRRKADRAICAQPRERCRFVDDLNVDGIDQHDRGLLARVIAALEDGEAGQCAGVNVQPLQNRRWQVRLDMVERQLNVSQSQHAGKIQ